MKKEHCLIIDIITLLQQLKIKDYWLEPQQLITKTTADLETIKQDLISKLEIISHQGENNERASKNDQN